MEEIIGKFDEKKNLIKCNEWNRFPTDSDFEC